MIRYTIINTARGIRAPGFPQPGSQLLVQNSGFRQSGVHNQLLVHMMATHIPVPTNPLLFPFLKNANLAAGGEQRSSNPATRAASITRRATHCHLLLLLLHHHHHHLVSHKDHLEELGWHDRLADGLHLPALRLREDVGPPPYRHSVLCCFWLLLLPFGLFVIRGRGAVAYVCPRGPSLLFLLLGDLQVAFDL